MIVYEFNKSNQHHVSIKLWFKKWESYVIDKDFSSARKLFDKNVVSFGTWMDVVQGLDNLEKKQWKKIWPKITNFTFLTETLFVQLSLDNLFSNCVLAWDSVGYDEFGKKFKRSGRATITLNRDNFNKPWKAIHSHLSLNRNVPQISYGKKISE